MCKEEVNSARSASELIFAWLFLSSVCCSSQGYSGSSLVHIDTVLHTFDSKFLPNRVAFLKPPIP